jgi:integrase
MPHVNWRGKYIHLRWLRADGTWGSTSKNLETGLRWTSEEQAMAWGEDRELKERLGVIPADDRQARPAEKHETTVAEWFAKWWPAQDLGLRSRGNYTYLFEAYILPEWGHRELGSITASEVSQWEQRLIAAGYERGGVVTAARSKLATLLGDAVVEGLIGSNPALRQRNRGRRSGVGTAGRTQEKVWTSAREALLIAERMGALGHRDDEFVFGILGPYSGMRWAERVGLQPKYVRPHSLRVDWQLEEDGGKLYLLPPKDDSNRSIDLPPFLSLLLANLIGARDGQRCRCKPVTVDGQTEQPCQGGQRFVFLGPRHGHYRNSNFARDFVDPAADGRYREEKGRRYRPARRVLVNLGEGAVWPGEPWPHWESVIRGKGSGSRVYDPGDGRIALAEWMPVADGLSAHGDRHAHSTWLGDLGTPLALRDERMGHVSPENRGMRRTYTHVSELSRVKLRDDLQELFDTSLAQRAWLGLRSPVPALDALLAPFRDGKREPVSPVPRLATVIPLYAATG